MEESMVIAQSTIYGPVEQKSLCSTDPENVGLSTLDSPFNNIQYFGSLI